MQAQALIERDGDAYREASAVLMQSERSARHGVAGPAMATAAPSEDDRERLLGEAMTHAADLALAIADASAQIAELAAAVARRCPASLRPDALTAVALAEAAACASAQHVEVNRKLPADDPRRAASSEAAQMALAARERTL